MIQDKKPINSHQSYHAHVYFDADTRELAEKVCHEAKQRFGLSIGRLHERPVGPHPCWSCQITFHSEHFDTFIPWLDEHRQNLTVFIHAVTGDDWSDHTEYAYWLGEAAELNLDIFTVKRAETTGIKNDV